ncbi:M42 family peptidase [Candidatus Thorarchaeota archaeon]|nr:MAG: M42 family peptidase [Candidatus Thorarchaeota archaeon]
MNRIYMSTLFESVGISLSGDIFTTLKDLCDLPGPVGREGVVQKRIREELSQYCDEIKTDKIGNLTATMEGTKSHYAVVAHADEVGFLVSSIDDNGFIQAKWNTQGYQPDMRLMPGQRVLFMSDQGMIPGCFCVKTAHIAGAKGKKKIPSWDEVFIDIGAESSEEVHEMGIDIGTHLVYDAGIEQIGKNVVGKSLDDRVGLAVILHLAKLFSQLPQVKKPRVTFVSTVMEEIGAKGASAVADEMDVDAVLVLEIGLADDYPGTQGEANVDLGKGPVIVIKDNQIVYSHELTKALGNISKEKGIETQKAVYHNYATDGYRMASQGQKVAAIGVPCRYSHSSFETIRIDDVKNTLKLVYEFLLRNHR